MLYLNLIGQSKIRRSWKSRSIVCILSCNSLKPLKKRDKLSIELLRAQTNNDLDQCPLIEHLIDVTKNVVNAVPGKKIMKLLGNEPTYVISR
jgi:hypothetical protein